MKRKTSSFGGTPFPVEKRSCFSKEPMDKPVHAGNRFYESLKYWMRNLGCSLWSPTTSKPCCFMSVRNIQIPANGTLVAWESVSLAFYEGLRSASNKEIVLIILWGILMCLKGLMNNSVLCYVERYKIFWGIQRRCWIVSFDRTEVAFAWISQWTIYLVLFFDFFHYFLTSWSMYTNPDCISWRLCGVMVLRHLWSIPVDFAGILVVLQKRERGRPPGGGGTAICGPYRYVPLWRVWFSSSLL